MTPRKTDRQRIGEIIELLQSDMARLVLDGKETNATHVEVLKAGQAVRETADYLVTFVARLVKERA